MRALHFIAKNQTFNFVLHFAEFWPTRRASQNTILSKTCIEILHTKMSDKNFMRAL